MVGFNKTLKEHGIKLGKRKIEILQVNVGKLCNLTCSHCHVEAGPTKTKENMNFETARQIVQFMDSSNIHTLDLTGGAPELNRHFKYLVTEARKRDIKVIDRCNLTVFYEPAMLGLPQFLADNQVEIIASLPCYQKDNVDKQRGKGVFDQSIKAISWLNELGYGKENTKLILNLAYNPILPQLPPPQLDLEKEYKQRLFEDLGIVFNRLYTITNMPVTRYEKYLKAFDQYDDYMELLRKNFNINTVDDLMCLNTLNVSWDGKIYDCDFNQMLGMQMKNGKYLSIFDLNKLNIENFDILTGSHCFGCTAGYGSSCQGALK